MYINIIGITARNVCLPNKANESDAMNIKTEIILVFFLSRI
jgi:hypothetical protein